MNKVVLPTHYQLEASPNQKTIIYIKMDTG